MGPFRNNKNNEAFLDRVYIVKVRIACAFPKRSKSTRNCLITVIDSRPLRPWHAGNAVTFFHFSRLKEPENSSIYSKMRVYDAKV